ncbi:MAG: hypothetical protein ACYDFS_11120 [Vulcanimicrobiaceae bacterium]
MRSSLVTQGVGAMLSRLRSRQQASKTRPYWDIGSELAGMTCDSVEITERELRDSGPARCGVRTATQAAKISGPVATGVAGENAA